MNKRRMIYTSAVALALAGGIPAAAFAAGEADEQAEAQMMQQASVSLADAIKAAEAAEGGKALGATFKGGGTTPGYEVEIVLPDGSTRSVFVDGQSGQVTTAVADASDSDNGMEEQEEAEHHEDEDGEEEKGEENESH